MKRNLFLLLLGFNNFIYAQEFPVLKGEYWGQKPPGTVPEVYSPGIASGYAHGRVANSTKCYEVYGVVNPSKELIVYSKLENGIWTKPVLAYFVKDFLAIDYGGSQFSPDGEKLFFYSNRPGGMESFDIKPTDRIRQDFRGKDHPHYIKKHYLQFAYPKEFFLKAGAEVLTTFSNQFYAGKASVVRPTLGKGTVTYIGVDKDDSQLKKDILQDIFSQAGVTTENYQQGVYVYWCNGFNVAVNYSSENYTVNIPANAKIIFGDNVLKPAGVTMWSVK